MTEASAVTLKELKIKARRFRRNDVPFSQNVYDVENELRKRRKAFLGTAVPLTDIVYTDGNLDPASVDILIDYMTSRTVYYWKTQLEEAQEFCRCFYELSIVGIADPYMQDQCVDDIIRLATLLTHDPLEVFEIVMKELLPLDYLPRLYSFTEGYDTAYFVASFENAVQAAVCVLVGVLTDPLEEERR